MTASVGGDTPEVDVGAGAMSMQKESANLDLLRSYAVLLVLVDHVLTWFGIERIGYISTFDMGMLGVLFFFVHTTLVLMLSLERQRAKLGGQRLFAIFMVRRFFRIYPLSMLVVLCIFAFGLPWGFVQHHHMGHFVATWKAALANLALMQNLTYSPSLLGPLWSLPLEIQMYLFLPLLFLLAGRVQSVKPLLALWVLGVAGAMVIPEYVSGRLSVAAYVPNFVPGVIAYKLAPSMSRNKLPFWGWPVALFGLTSLFMFTQPVEHGWLVCLLTGLAIPYFREMQQPWLRRVSHVIAKYSYGIYLGHFACIWLAFIVLARAHVAVQWCALVAGLFAIPYILYHAIEAPMIGVGARVGNALAVRPEAPSAPTQRAFAGEASEGPVPAADAGLGT